MNKELNNFEMMELINKLPSIKENNISLTITVKAFFIELYKFIRENGICEENGKYYVQYNNLLLSEKLGFSYSITCQALSNLVKAGAIERIPCRSFKKMKDGKYTFNKPCKTYISNLFLNLIEGNELNEV